MKVSSWREKIVFLTLKARLTEKHIKLLFNLYSRSVFYADYNGINLFLKKKTFKND